MKILLTNDDGVYAEGLKTLREVLKEKHEVFMVAPEREMSASGHAITLHKPLRVIEIKMKDGSISWAVNGTPADCVKLALVDLLPEKPDLIISGINYGANLGNDVFYSGTVSAALEGYFMGLPAIAISLAVDSQEADYSHAARYCLKLVEVLGEKIIKDQLLLNVNIPNVSEEEIKGVKLCRLGNKTYIDIFDQRIDPRGQKYYWLAGDLAIDNLDEESDTFAVKEGYISITPLDLDLTDFSQFPSLEKIIKE